MKMVIRSLICCALWGPVAVAGPPDRPSGVEFRVETLRRVGGHGDNWCLTWAADDSQVTSMDDGGWLEGPQSYSNHLFRVVGGPGDFRRDDLPGYPSFAFNERGWFGYGLVSVDGIFYSFVSKCPENRWSGPFWGFKLLKSTDNGMSWSRVDRQGAERRLFPGDPARHAVDGDEMFFLEESGREGHGGIAYPFASCEIVQNGRDNRAARDDYVYVYSPEGSSSHQLLLARAPKAALGRRAAWEFFAGRDGDRPRWDRDLGARRPVHEFPATDSRGDAFGWYSWLPSVVWNEGLGLYIMANGGTYAGHGLTSRPEDYYSAWMHTRSGSLGFWYAKDPWGPWTRFFYTEEWTVDAPGNRTYQPKLSPKWISPDGKAMVLIWSDAMKDQQGRSHTTNYRWNQMEITVRTASDPG